MYSVNGAPLASTARGWVFRSLSRPLSEMSRTRSALRRDGRDGVVGGLPSTISPVTLQLVVQTRKPQLETLLALVGDGGVLTKTDDATRSVVFETLSHSLAGHGPAELIVDVTFVIRLPGAFWRSAADATSAAVALAPGSVQVSGLFSGISAPVADALVRVKGATTGLQVTDTAGSWFTYSPALAAGKYLRFESATGRAFTTDTDVWGGGTEVSGAIDFGGPRGVFEITPRLSASDPASRDARLTVATASATAASVQVRGRGAFLV